MNYDFSQLNDKEFESLVADLLSKHFTCRIERFKGGRDSGVDGRFFCDDKGEVILQCKHYLKTGLPGLLSNLRNKEKLKIKKLFPKRYIFITSLPLSRKNKQEIKSLLNHSIKRADDIFGKEDLNQLLLEYPKIEERYFKLWISSTNVLQRLMNNAIKGRSDFAIQQIREKSKKYVQTENHIKALKILEEKNVVIISGEPGIGKTTLAENLCLHFTSHDYEFVEIQQDISEAEELFLPKKRQLFYYDDFLGSNYLEAIENKRDSHVVRFIDRVKSDKTKLFILTSRTNILNSGILHSCIFANNKIFKNEFLLTIESLFPLDKARMLYNHIWHSKLEESFIDEIYKDKRYRKIISHRNFNPRLIEFITDLDRISAESCIDYWDFVQKTLGNPKDIWDDCFKRQNNPYVRCLVLLVVFNGGDITEEELRSAYLRFIKKEGLINNSFTEKDFLSSVKLATKLFLNRKKRSEAGFYSLFNPSISDYILREYGNDVNKLLSVYFSLQTVKSLEQIDSLEHDSIISPSFCLKVKNQLFDELGIDEVSYDYIIYLAYYFGTSDRKRTKIIDMLKYIIQKPKEINYIVKFIFLLDYYSVELKLKCFNFIFKLIGVIALTCE